MAQLVPDVLVGATALALLEEVDDFDEGLGVLCLVLLGDAVGLEDVLPFSRQSLRQTCQSGGVRW